MTAHPGALPVPARITMALDLRELYGPEVDRALGGEEPMVDQWEAGELVPTRAQVEKLAELTGFPIAWFYRPPDELGTTTTFICDRRRRGENGLTVVESRVDWDGVLHRRELTPPRPPYRPRTATPAASTRRPRPGTHRPMEDQETPGYCRCGLSMSIRNARHDLAVARGEA